ncbi:MAG: hypothetical protein HYR49_10655 [Gammaproteobacteria bacterium]|nr:hypothetical protein [Gammaproteobacteria bacterium]
MTVPPGIPSEDVAMITHMHSRMLLILPVFAATLGACTDALVYGESTNLSIASFKVNDNVAQPFSVNFELDRTVAALVPPMHAGGEAANLIAGFKMDDSGKLPFGTKTITTEFASGKAAEVMVQKHPQEALRIMGAEKFSKDRYSDCITGWINESDADRTDRIAYLNEWWRKKGHTDNSSYLRYTASYTKERKEFVEEASIACQ